MKRSILNLLGGLLLCLPMLFTSCNSKDNALEEIVNQPNLEGLQKALYKNAEVTIKYKVYGGVAEGYTATLKNVGTVEKPEYKFEGEMPDVYYDLVCDMGYADNNLYFGLLYKSPDPNAAEDDDETDDLFDLSPVMVVKFDTKTSKYDVYALPGFEFEVISINGTNMMNEVTKASTDEATINFFHQNAGPEQIEGLEMKLNLNGVSTWKQLDEAYDEVGLGVFASINDQDETPTETGDMVIDLSDYEGIYFPDDADDHYWKVFVIFDSGWTEAIESDKDVTATTYLAKDFMNQIYIPCYGLNSKGRIALVDMLTLQMPNATTITWKQIVNYEDNSNYIKIAYSTADKPTVVGAEGKIGTNGGYYGLYEKSNPNARVNANTEYVVAEFVAEFRNKDFHFYQLQDKYKDLDKGYTEPRDHTAEPNLRW